MELKSFYRQSKFDYNDLSNFIPDNFVLGTEQFYKKKFGDKLPDAYYRYLQKSIRPEYDEQDKLNAINDIRKEQVIINNKLMNEYLERQRDTASEGTRDTNNYYLDELLRKTPTIN